MISEIKWGEFIEYTFKNEHSFLFTDCKFFFKEKRKIRKLIYAFQHKNFLIRQNTIWKDLFSKEYVCYVHYRNMMDHNVYTKTIKINKHKKNIFLIEIDEKVGFKQMRSYYKVDTIREVKKLITTTFVSKWDALIYRKRDIIENIYASYDAS